MGLSKLVDPRTKPASQLCEYSEGDLPEDYDDTKHGPPPMFVKYEGMAEKVIESLEYGMTQEQAAVAAGTTRNTLAAWLRKGRRAREKFEEVGPDALAYWDPFYIRFLEMVEAKDFEIQQTLLKRIYDAGNDSWQANAWIMERRFGWTKTDEVKHTGAGGGPIKVTLSLGENEIKALPQAEVDEIAEADWEHAKDD